MINRSPRWYRVSEKNWPFPTTRIAFIALAILAYPAVFYGAYAAWENSHTRVLDWLPERLPETQELFSFVDRFGSDELLAIGWEGMTTADPRAGILRERLLDEVPHRGGKGAYFAHAWTANQVLEQLTQPPLELSDQQAQARMRGWILGDKDQTAVLAKVSDLGMTDRHGAVRYARQMALEVSGLPIEAIHIAGPTVESVFIDELNQQSLLELNGFSLLTCLLLLLYCLRNWFHASVVFGIAVYCQQIAMAIIHYTGGHMDSVVMLTASLAMVLSVSACIHLYGYYRNRMADGQASGLVGSSLQDAFVPTLWAVLTTAFGLVSLLVSDLTPIYSFGLYGAIAVPLTTLLGLWYLCMYLPSQQTVPASQLSRLPTGMGGTPEPLADSATLAMKSWPLVFAATGCLLVVGAMGLPHLRANVGLNNLLESDSKILQDYRWLEQHIGPIVPVEIVLRLPRSEDRSTVDELRVVTALQQAVVEGKSVHQAISALNFLPPLPRQEGRQSMGQVVRNRVLERRITDSVDDLVAARMLYQDPQAHHWRITAKVSGAVDQDYEQIIQEIKSATQSALAPWEISEAEVLVSGGVPVVVRTQMHLLRDMVKSFLLALLLIYMALAAVLRNPLAGLLALLPNAMPAIVVFGMMGLLGLKAEVGGVMTASVALGIAVDDSLHLLHQFRRFAHAGLGHRMAAVLAYRRCRRAVLHTSLIIGGGMFVFALSSFVPISRFAWLTVLLLVVALASNLMLLTSILYSPLGALFYRADVHSSCHSLTPQVQ